jgi:glucose/arabinose dehydrogenase
MRVRLAAVIAFLTLSAIFAIPSVAADPSTLLTGAAAFGDWQTDGPGVRRKITAADLPPPFATQSVRNRPSIVERPNGAMLHVPSGFTVNEAASGLDDPRLVRVAPNGDIFIAESMAGQVRVLRMPDGTSTPTQNQVFVSHLTMPFGIAFWPPGPNPSFIYIANTDSVVRIPYHNGDLEDRSAPQVVVPDLPGGGHLMGGGHWTRDVVFSKDGSRMFVSVGSKTNDEPDAVKTLPSSEEHRADVLQFDPEGKNSVTFATGLRNCVGMAVNPATGDLWCSTNERDTLGDNLPPHLITRVREGGFYGWPWYYIGRNEDPNHKGERPDLKDKVIVPDVLLQAHSASLEMTFYEGNQFPSDYRGDAFAAEHGSWNRERRTGYKIIRVIVRNGVPTGEYDDFLTGFVTSDGDVWGRPVGVAVAHDGSLIVTEDAHGTVWRISYAAGPASDRK